jgi:hypothetical protein
MTILMLLMSCLKRAMHISDIAQYKKLKNKKKELNKKNFLTSIIENGEILWELMYPKI